ncbi:unnamed protein product [Meganyctiphanes norvegica]|uniref:Uncharacterized protein n=1 Tax=Meganyctiphanes norvegica TaxID=48144 RepID=A0AAV2QQ35_MEGNR
MQLMGVTLVVGMALSCLVGFSDELPQRKSLFEIIYSHKNPYTEAYDFLFGKATEDVEKSIKNTLRRTFPRYFRRTVPRVVTKETSQVAEDIFIKGFTNMLENVAKEEVIEALSKVVEV